MIGAVSQAMEVFELLVNAAEGVSVGELSGHLGINKGSVSRLLTTLETDGYLVQNSATGRYELTLKLPALINRFTDRLGFPGSAQPVLQRLATQVGELVELSAADGDKLYVIAEAEGDARIAVKPLMGRVLAPHASASGKAWLSALPVDQACAIAAKHGLLALTDRTVLNLSLLRTELEEAAALGYATQDEELMPHVSAIAVPVRHRVTGAPVGALVIVAPTFRFPKDRYLEFAQDLRAAAEELAAIWPDSLAHGTRTDGMLPGSTD